VLSAGPAAAPAPVDTASAAAMLTERQDRFILRLLGMHNDEPFVF
jgi:hypothetical protein